MTESISSKDVSAFFTPESHDNLTTHHPKARIAIIEGVRPLSKTITVGAHGNSIVVSDSSSDNLTSRVNKKFTSSPHKDNNNSVDVQPHSFHGSFRSMPNEKVDVDKITVNGSTATKTSKFSSFLGRFSHRHSRQKSYVDVPHDATMPNVPATKSLKPSRKSTKIKRWFSRRMFGGTRSGVNNSGEASTASADAIIDVKLNLSSDFEGCNSVPLTRRTIQTNAYGSSTSGNESDGQMGSTQTAKVVASTQHAENGNLDGSSHLSIPSVNSTNRQRMLSSSLLHSPSSTAAASSKLSPPPTVNGSSSTSFAPTPGTLSSNMLSRKASRSEASVTTALLRRQDTPSYLSLSVSAFGYSGYSRSTDSVSGGVRVPADDLPAKPEGDELDPPQPAHSPKTASNGLRPDNLNLGIVDPSATQLSFVFDEQNNSRATSSPTSSSKPEAGSFLTVQLRRSRTRSGNQSDVDRDHFQRSSLIMLAVSHASPRARPLTPVAAGSGVSDFLAVPSTRDSQESVSSSSASISTASVDRPAPTTPHQPRLQPVDESPPTRPADDRVNGMSTTTDPVADLPPSPVPDTLTGHHFLALADQTEAELVAEIKLAEADLANVALTDEILGNLRTSIGQAGLLLSKKFAQFRSLCHQNLASSPADPQDSNNNALDDDAPHLVTLASDLDGFWAMVLLQVDNVRRQFSEIDALRRSGWQLADSSSSSTTTPVSKSARPSVKSSRAKTSSTKPSDLTASYQKTRPKVIDSQQEARAKAARQRLALAKQRFNKGPDNLKSTPADSAFIVF